MIKLNKKENDYICSQYVSGLSCAKIAKQFNVSHAYIISVLEKNNILRRQKQGNKKYSVNEHYFDVIDTEEKAYFLGFLYADGCNYTPNNHIHIPLQESDKEILEKFIKLIEYTGPLLFINTNKKFPNKKNLYRLNICNKILSNRLTELGCIHQKSLKLKFPNDKQVPCNLIKHFIRGYFDGDGSFTLYKNKKTGYYKWCACITSSKKFCESLKLVIKEKVGINTYIKKDRKCLNILTGSLAISGKNQTEKFLDWIYKESKIKLERKWLKYLEHKSFLNDKKDIK